MSQPDKRKRRGFVRVGSSIHQAMVLISEGLTSDGPEIPAISTLVSMGYVTRTYALTEAGSKALSEAMQVKRRSRHKSDFDVSHLHSSLIFAATKPGH